MRSRVNRLCDNFDYYLKEFDETARLTGPSVYFHIRTLNTLERLGVRAALEDLNFLEYLYATLTSWGLHKMGPIGAKLVDFESFRTNLSNQRDCILSLQNYKLGQLTRENSDAIVNALWKILSSLRISETKTQIVAGSGTLHHLLPNLMPPIDRAHTIRFFYCRRGVKTVALPSGGEERIFKQIYPFFIEIALRNQENIAKHIYHGLHTSETKVIDNVIIEFAEKELT